MADIDVSETGSGDGWSFDVTVREGGSSTSHRVKLSKSDYERLTASSQLSPSDLVKKSFDFLLERESKESILSSFELTLIGRYFPEYESTIG